MAVSQRLARTSSPIIVRMGQLMQKAPPGSISLAQGQVHWGPPETAIERVKRALSDDVIKVSRYGPDEGLAELRSALTDRLALAKNEHVMVTQGANQAIVNCLLATTDANSAVGLMTPFYFNHHMAITELSCRIHLIPRSNSMHTTAADIEEAVVKGKLKALILTNPCNPTGTVLVDEEVTKISEVCGKHGCALILDNTYSDFVYDGRPRPSRNAAAHVFNVYSFSKNYGMSGWRMGFVSYNETFAESMLKIQDTIAICPTQIAQQAALGALDSGTPWIAERVRGLVQNRDVLRLALEEGGSELVCGGEGAIYLFAKLPASSRIGSEKEPSSKKHQAPKDLVLTEQLLLKHGIAVIPGSSCGMPGWIRVCFANLPYDKCTQASERLATGLKDLLHR